MVEIDQPEIETKHGFVIVAIEVVAFAALLASAAFLLLYLAIFYRPSFNSDDAVVSMLGETLWSQGRLIPFGWISFNGDLMIPSGALVVAPLLRWFSNGYAVHAAASYVAVALLLGSVAYFLTMLRIPRPGVVLVLTFLAAGVSYDFTTMVYAQTTYVWWSAGFCLAAGLVLSARRQIHVSALFPLGKAIVICLVVFCVSFANPARVFMMMVLPLYAFDRVLANALASSSVDSDTNFMRRNANLLGIRDGLTLSTLAAYACAACAYLLLMRFGRTEVASGVLNPRWGGIESVWRHIGTLADWFGYLGGSVHGRDANPLAFAALRPFRFLVSVALTTISIYEICRWPRTTEASRRALAAALVVAFVPVFAAYALFEPFAVNGGSLRYFMVAIIIVILLPVFVLRGALGRWPLASCFAMALAGCLLAGVAMQRFIPFSIIKKGLHEANAPSAQMRLAEDLQRAGLHWGYASWWNAGVTTVLSDSKVRVTPVMIGPSGWVSAGTFMVLKDWYRPSAWIGPTFLALDVKESSARSLDDLHLFLGDSQRVLDIPPYKVLVFENNIAARFGCERRVAMNTPLRRGQALPALLSAKLEAWHDPRVPEVLKVQVRNDSAMTVSGEGRFPLAIGVKLLDTGGHVVAGDWSHSAVGCPIAPGESLEMKFALPKAPDGSWLIRVDFVQEHVAWLGDNWGAPVLLLPLSVGAADDAEATPGSTLRE